MNVAVILSSWLNVHGSESFKNESAEIVNLILVCLGKIEMTQNILEKAKVKVNNKK